MNEKETGAHADHDVTPPSPPDTTSQPEARSRRELIERYGKYALVAGPLLMFVSKARAIHSAP